MGKTNTRAADATKVRATQATKDADKARAVAESADWMSKAVALISAYARTPRQTATLARTLYAAGKHGVSIRDLADEWAVKDAGFSRARIGQFVKAVKRVIETGIEVPETGTLDDATCNLLARMVSVVSGSTLGIPSAVLDAMLETLKTSGADAVTIKNALDAELDSHELTTAAKGDTEPAETAAEVVSLPATAIVTTLARMRGFLADGVYSDADVASIHSAVADAVAALESHALALAVQGADAETPVLA